MADARHIVLRLQAQGDHSEEEIRAQLERRGFSRLEIDDAVTWGRDNAALSDERATESTIRREEQRGRGALRVQASLERRGLDPEAFSPDQTAELLKAEAALLPRREKYAGNPLAAAGYLARQGFDEDVVRRVVERLVGPLHDT